jgi:uncharacterized protein YjbI with pentapeptide repeats
MHISRRHILLGAGATATTRLKPASTRAQDKRVSQSELDKAIRLHAMWLANINEGRRCMFSGRDLSGLRFGDQRGPPIDLSGADFTQADLTGTEADDILIHHCGFNGAIFDDCHWRQPVFAFADLRRASAKQVIWGTPGPRDLLEPPRADFSHVALHDADLTEAKICGFFYGTKLVRARLCHADFSHSNFLGPKHYDTTFSSAQMIGARLRHCQISSVSFYNANCTEVDFSHSGFWDVRMKGCNLRGACFNNAAIQRWMLSPDQKGQADLRNVKVNKVDGDAREDLCI